MAAAAAGALRHVPLDVRVRFERPLVVPLGGDGLRRVLGEAVQVEHGRHQRVLEHHVGFDGRPHVALLDRRRLLVVYRKVDELPSALERGNLSQFHRLAQHERLHAAAALHVRAVALAQLVELARLAVLHGGEVPRHHLTHDADARHLAPALTVRGGDFDELAHDAGGWLVEQVILRQDWRRSLRAAARQPAGRLLLLLRGDVLPLVLVA
mmetsp:Transcript_23916/g.74106  ORF Transcript_23916/g.74106 Transcript_23916/m.74106 type:complete len:210 (-) Transcript_23916:2815-3444(-)